MALKEYQTEITKDVIYVAAHKGGDEQISPTIHCKGGDAALYTSQQTPASIVDMDEDAASLNAGTNVLKAVPNYILVSGGSATNIVVSGVRLEVLV